MTNSGSAKSRLNTADRVRLQSIRRETSDTLRSALGARSKSIAFLDFPNYRNFGDSLIWQGTREYLSELGLRVRYAADRHHFKDDHLRKLPGDCVIIMQGGGNLGDLYPQHEIFRRHVVSRFRRRRIVFMPQSVHFTDPSALAESVAVYQRADGLTILLRDPMSMAVAEDAFADIDYRFCPDHAFGVPLEATRRSARGEPVILGRRDKEANEAIISELDSSVDWSPSPTNMRVWRGVLRGRNALEGLPVWLEAVTLRTHQLSYAVMSWANVHAATRQLESAPWVATNRLHAHVLAILLGIPHVVTDNSYGKISAIYSAYSGAFTTSHWAGSLAEAVHLAKTLSGSSTFRGAS